MRYLLVVAIFIMFFSGCAIKQPTKTQSVMVSIITPNMKYSDLGFIKYYPNSTGLEIYSFGKALLDLRIYENRVCSSTFECISSDEFVRKYIHPSYPNTFFNNILHFDDLENMGGIEYEYTKNGNLYYRDRINNILIRINKD
ncbi:hypothetical protein [Arcobacter sp. FWKO B]|uniref:hypothetical protein n=1 Tax=Arcobacter sp. FWKO B TaxID=2593672 RepID=UPI0018A5A36B|nr:hypothetical protein [Arcobacter sp. FWKO B]QOG12209.1 hypothetical protein FWKOB_05600 [Arcobacter sp. FWKO B]